jgi:hypothetical protein
MTETGPNEVQGNILKRLEELEESGFTEIAGFLRALADRPPSSISRHRPLRLAPPVDDGVSPTDDGALVESKDMMMKVLLDANRDYSVSGYGKRAVRCFGEFYLCLDAGSEYDQQAGQINAAIQRISEPASFSLALKETRIIIQDDPGAGIDNISPTVLAHICNLWFGLPDGTRMITSEGPSLSSSTASCPGDFAATSGYIFSADPSPFLEHLAMFCGSKLKDSGTRAVPHLRSAPLPADSLSRVILDAFPDDNLAMRTIIGVMMGMLPTLDNNLKNVVKAWQADGDTLPRLRTALQQSDEPDPYLRASGVLSEPLMRTMQLNPVPADIWRTAVRDHTLADTVVGTGARVTLSIESVTRADAAAGVIDPFPIFGGNRNVDLHPIHACPGYDAAMGIMLGVINGILEPTDPPQ